MGLLSCCGSGVLLRLAVTPEPRCLWDGKHGPLHPRRPRGGTAAGSGQHQRPADGQADQRAASAGGWGATAEKDALLRGERGPQGGRKTPSAPTNEGKKGARGPTAALPSLSLSAALRRGGVLTDPRASDRPPPASLLCHVRLPSPRPPSPARAPAGSPQRSPSGRLIRGTSAGVGGGSGSSSTRSSSRSSGGGRGGSAPRGAGGRLPRPIAALGTAGSGGVLPAPAQVARLASRPQPRPRTWGGGAGAELRSRDGQVGERGAPARGGSRRRAPPLPPRSGSRRPEGPRERSPPRPRGAGPPPSLPPPPRDPLSAGLGKRVGLTPWARAPPEGSGLGLHPRPRPRPRPGWCPGHPLARDQMNRPSPD